MKVILAQPRGFCAGVIRAIDIVERALAKHDAPVYVRHEIVHNRYVVERLKAKGARFVEELADVPAGAMTIFSAHGVSRAVEADAAARRLNVLDATCPLVTKVHNQGQRYSNLGRTVILIGHAGHVEVQGTLGRISGPVYLVENRDDVEQLDLPDDTPIAYITQTTLSVDDTRATIEAIKSRFSDVIGPETRDICYATQNRQTAVRRAVRARRTASGRRGEPTAPIPTACAKSAPSAASRAISSQTGARSSQNGLPGRHTIGITAGASAPDVLVDDVIAALAKLEPIEIETLQGIEEKITFRLPR